MRKSVWALLCLSCGPSADRSVLAQTSIDIGRQARNVDFSNAAFTKSFKTGTSVPATCSQGETYLKVDAPAGQNIYVCTSTNVWAVQASGGVAENSFEWSRISVSQAQISHGSFRFGNTVTALMNPGTITVQGSTSGSIWVYGILSGAVVVAHNLGSGNLTVSGTGFSMDALGTGFPAASLPLYRCSVATGVLPVSCTDLRTALSATSIGAGFSGALSVDCSGGKNCMVDVVPVAVPLTTAANTFTGLNTFSHLKLPSGGAPNPLACASASDAGKIWVQTTGTSGRQIHICEGVSGWRIQGEPDNISTAVNVGYTSSVPIGVPLAAQTAVASNNQIRLVLVPVANPVRIARLAAWIATAFAGGKARAGIYTANGTLLAQTGALDTGAASGQDSAVTPVVLNPGYYYFAWSVDNTAAQLAGSGNGSMTGLFNRVSASPGQATCSQSMTASGLPSTCTIVPWPNSSGFPVIAIAGFAQ